MQLISDNFQHKGLIPYTFTCDGDNIPPHLAWSDIPESTKSFALACTDPDAPSGTFIHWLVINIPPNVTETRRGEKLPGNALKSHFGTRGYGGPCPPSGTHRYFFTIYALDVDQLDGVRKENFQEMIEPHVIDKADLIGTYARVKI